MDLYLAETSSGIAFLLSLAMPLVFSMSSNSINSLYQTLEFHKVLEDLAKRTHCSLSADRLRRLKPLENQETVQGCLDWISEIRTFMDSGGSVPMDLFEDIRAHLDKASIEGSYLEPKAFRKIYKILALSFRFHKFLKEHRQDLPLVFRIGNNLAPCRELAEEISRVIDLQSLEIRNSATPKLAAIRRDLARTREQVRKQLEALLGSLAKQGVLQERFITERSGRWVIPVKETHRHLVKGVLHDKSASGATAFIEPLKTLELNNKIRRLEAEERHEVEKVLRILTDFVREERDPLEEDLAILVSLDCLLAKAMASRVLDQHAPALNESGVLRIKNGRHPLLVLKQTAATEVVPLTLSIGESFHTLVITGPNAGGKTVALKTIGLLALMVACGLHIPADADSEVPVFQNIFAHVGDAQSIEMDLSTFSAHLGDIKNIVQWGAPGDLVLVDEIGSGTDPQEGSALAMAVLEDLTARGVMTVVTTHHGTLKAFAHETPGIANGSMAFDGQTLTPTYRFRPDVPGSSYAFEIAERLGLSETVIARSRLLMGSQATHLEQLVQELSEQIDLNKRLGKDLDADKALVERLRQQYEAENARLKKDGKALRQEAVEEARAIVKNANAAIEEAIRTIREKAASKESIREAKALVQKEKKALDAKFKPLLQPDEPAGKALPAGALVPGSHVSWQRNNMVGVVMSGEDQSGRILVAFDKLKAHVPKHELKKMAVAEKSMPARGSAVNVSVSKKVQTEIDIRGMRVEEALDAVDKFLDDAVLVGLQEVRVIHGVGTGALRNSLGPFLDSHPHVMEAKVGDHEQANPGVTIVTMGGR
jgi:DNA mismatch repair protein MutS2